MKEYIVSEKEIGTLGEVLEFEQVTRCKECRNWWSEKGICMRLSKDNVYQIATSGNDYCSNGKRMEE